MHQKEYPSRKNKNRIEQTPKTRENQRNTCLENATKGCTDRREKVTENYFKKDNCFVLKRCCRNMISNCCYPISALYYNRI